MARLNILKLPRAVAPAPAEPEPLPAPQPDTLCLGCAVAHIVAGHSAEQETILCGLGGWLREIPYQVARCSDFRKRVDRATRVGFGAGV